MNRNKSSPDKLIHLDESEYHFCRVIGGTSFFPFHDGLQPFNYFPSWSLSATLTATFPSIQESIRLRVRLTWKPLGPGQW
ncbi:unnamed protein product [Nezara viridula]|uniref:Uncharacterized protein n=1 Tax=Nezara viridula TaxID=85310 RepID=A0A9P0MSM2_NEZVI|nr:unnamed protein product [Nezara viridula]